MNLPFNDVVCQSWSFINISVQKGGTNSLYSARSQIALFDAPFGLQLRQTQKMCWAALKAASAHFFRLPRFAPKCTAKNAQFVTALSIHPQNYVRIWVVFWSNLTRMSIWREKLEKCLLSQPPSEDATTPKIKGAVLISVGFNREKGCEEILLTKRTRKVKTHKGQVSFPGGLREEQDSDLLATALREAQEEVGIQPKDILILGHLEPTKTRGSIKVFPWVGYMEFPYPIRINRDEVEKVFFLSITRLVSEGFRKVEVPVGPFRFKGIGIDVDGELVWGATARMLFQLRQRLLGL